MKLTHIIIATSLFFCVSSAALADSHDHSSHLQTAQTEQVIQGKGTIKQIDLTTGKVTITHEPIPALNWPSMTMRFTAQNASLIANLKPNDNVSFEFVQQGNLSILRSIIVIK